MVVFSSSSISIDSLGQMNDLRGREQICIRRSGRGSTADADFGPAIYFEIFVLECSDKRWRHPWWLLPLWRKLSHITFLLFQGLHLIIENK